MNIIYEELFKKRLGDIALISEKLPIDLGQQVASKQRISVIKIPGGENKIKDFSLIVYDKMQFQSKEPTYAAIL